MVDRHYANAEKQYKQGLEALKTNLFKWNKDYASAAMHFDDAVKMFKLAKDSQGALKTYKKLIECNDKLNDHWSLAKNHEAIIQLAMDDSSLKMSDAEILDLTDKACIYFKGADSVNNYFLLVQKVCKFFEKKGSLDEAVDLYERAFSEMDDTKLAYMRSDMLNAYLAILVNRGRYDLAAIVLEKEVQTNKENPSQKSSGHLQCLTVVILYLLNGDGRNAEQKMQNYASNIYEFIHSRELEVAEKLVESYLEGNQDAFNQATNIRAIEAIYPTNIIKLIRQCKVKADPNRPKIRDVEDLNIQNDYVADPEEEAKKVLPDNEADRQKALEDLLC